MLGEHPLGATGGLSVKQGSVHGGWKGMISRMVAAQSRPTIRLPPNLAAGHRGQRAAGCLPAVSFGASLKGSSSLEPGKSHQTAREGSVQATGLGIPCRLRASLGSRRRSGASGERGSAEAAAAGRRRFPAPRLVPRTFALSNFIVGKY